MMRQPDDDLEKWRRRVRLFCVGFNVALPKRQTRKRVYEIARIVADDTYHAQTANEVRKRGLAISRDYILGMSIDSLATKYDLTPDAVEKQIAQHGGKIIYSGGWPE